MVKIKEEIVLLVEWFFVSNRMFFNEGVYELYLLFNFFVNGVVCFDGFFFGFYLCNGISLEKFKWIIFF